MFSINFTSIVNAEVTTILCEIYYIIYESAFNITNIFILITSMNIHKIICNRIIFFTKKKERPNLDKVKKIKIIFKKKI